MKKASKPVTAKKPALKAPAMKQSKPKASARLSPMPKPAKAPVPAKLPMPAAKPLDPSVGQAELAQVVARLARSADKLAQAADRLAASAEKLGSAAGTLAEATRQAAQRQDAPAAMMPATEHTDSDGPPDFAAPPADPQEPDTSGGE
jgi:hypothetical protein